MNPGLAINPMGIVPPFFSHHLRHPMQFQGASSCNPGVTFPISWHIMTIGQITKIHEPQISLLLGIIPREVTVRLRQNWPKSFGAIFCGDIPWFCGLINMVGTSSKSVPEIPIGAWWKAHSAPCIGYWWSSVGSFPFARPWSVLLPRPPGELRSRKNHGQSQMGPCVSF